ncbi:MAG: hypothetical protein Q8943_12900 [Bacteroidota bacterium]|nr:hypothetical protein [Bacteroidota bacterium]
MPEPIHFPERKTPWLERFGVYYLDRFHKRDLTHHVFDLSDSELTRRVNRISAKGMILSALVGLLCVWPTVYIAVLKQAEPWLVQLAWTGWVTIASIVVEFYLLFVIALKAVHEVSELTNMRGHVAGNNRRGTRAAPEIRDFLHAGPFSITNILARAALEIHDPELHILGIDPFKRVSKLNLLLLGLLYKCKIVLSNFIAKRILLYTIGATLATAWVAGGISINYVALPVECFWNALILLRVVREARLRLFGYALCHEVADRILEEGALTELSKEARIGCLRAIANAVVLARNYHPNIVVLLLRIQHLLHLSADDHYDDWNLFMETLDRVNESERLFLLNLFTIAIAFDGRILRAEKVSLREAYGKYYEQYQPRLWQLTEDLRAGRLNAAADLCKIDFTAG